jgi:hypothetical protein
VGKEALSTPLALDWPRRWRETREQPLCDVLKQMNTSEKYAKYYDNAIAFVKYSERHHDWHKKPDGVNNFKYLRMVKKDEIDAQQQRSNDMDKTRTLH